jgi:hypothetical protein
MIRSRCRPGRAIVTITRAGSNVPTNLPTTTIVESGPYRFTRNPIYLGMFLGLIGLAIAFDNLWLLMMLVPFALVIRYGVVAREEAYLERKFGDVYRGYRSRVRRWLQRPPDGSAPGGPQRRDEAIELRCDVTEGRGRITVRHRSIGAARRDAHADTDQRPRPKSRPASLQLDTSS